MAKRNIPAGLVAVGFQTVSQSNTTAQLLNTTTRVAHVFNISVETQAVRYRADATAPALSTGVLLAVGNHWLENVPGAGLRFFRAAGGTSKISVMAFKYTGE